MLALIAPITEADRRIAGRVAALPASPLDDALKGLTVAANAGQLWLAIAAALATGGDQAARQAAGRGLVAVAVTAVVVNGVKPLFRRVRPAVAMPAGRSLDRRPVSTSFPSGHAATAAAFATAIAVASPRVGVTVAPLAALVAYSRVHVGVHWGSDVVAGAAAGTALAVGLSRLKRRT